MNVHKDTQLVFAESRQCYSTLTMHLYVNVFQLANHSDTSLQRVSFPCIDHSLLQSAAIVSTIEESLPHSTMLKAQTLHKQASLIRCQRPNSTGICLCVMGAKQRDRQRTTMWKSCGNETNGRAIGRKSFSLFHSV